MKTLLETTSRRYLRRLVSELNKHGTVDGFYALDQERSRRCNRANLSGGILRCRNIGGGWFIPGNQQFFDAHGREICASRSQ